MSMSGDEGRAGERGCAGAGCGWEASVALEEDVDANGVGLCKAGVAAVEDGVALASDGPAGAAPTGPEGILWMKL